MALKKAVQTAIDPKFFPLVLYKRILRLHYGLPPPARFLGDQYVKAEFRAHKDAAPQHLEGFYNEWMNYCKVLSDQLSNKGIVKGVIGKNLPADALDAFGDEQLRQLYELKVESDALKTGSPPQN